MTTRSENDHSRRSLLTNPILGAVAVLIVVVAVAVIVLVRQPGGGVAKARAASTTGPVPDPPSSTGGWVQESLAVGGTPKVVSGVALVATQSAAQGAAFGQVGSAALDVATGRLLWRVADSAIRSELVSTQPLGFATASGPVAVELETAGRSTELLVARAARTGTVRWRREVGRSSRNMRDFTPPVACGMSVCIRVGGRADSAGTAATVQALDPATGDVRWKRRVAETPNIVFANSDLVVVHSESSVLVAYAAGDGQRLWSLPTANDDGLNPETANSISVDWYVLGPVLIASIGSDSNSSLTAVDLRTGAVRWRHAGWSFAGDGQPTAGDDGITLVGATVLAVRADGQLAAFAADGHSAWSVAASKYFAGGRAVSLVGWNSDRSQVWASADQVSWTEGRSTATGARVVSPPPSINSIWVPHDPISGLDVAQPRVDLLTQDGATEQPAPAWAGAASGGRVLQVDRLGWVVSRRSS